MAYRADQCGLCGQDRRSHRVCCQTCTTLPHQANCGALAVQRNMCGHVGPTIDTRDGDRGQPVCVREPFHRPPHRSHATLGAVEWTNDGAAVADPR